MSFLGLWSGDALLSRKIMCATNASHVVKRYIYFPYICTESGEMITLIASYLVIFYKAETASF